jgi:hypothetical protein
MRVAPAGACQFFPRPIFDAFVTPKFAGIGNRLKRWLRETWLEDFMIMDAFPCAISIETLEQVRELNLQIMPKGRQIGLTHSRISLPMKTAAPVGRAVLFI